MLLYFCLVCSYMKQTLYCQTIVSIIASLPDAVIDIHKFNANSLHSTDVSKIAYTCLQSGQVFFLYSNAAWLSAEL